MRSFGGIVAILIALYCIDAFIADGMYFRALGRMTIEIIGRR